MPGSTLAKANSGFTLVELVTVIIVLGILSVAIGSRFFDRSGVDDVVTRDQILALARQVQMQAMQRTDSSSCHSLLVASHSVRVADANCALTAEDDLTVDAGSASLALTNGASAMALPATLVFNAMGQASRCNNGCRLEVQSAQSAALCIESQGYIHPC
ncbi:MAG: type II secretion system protein [Pseudomonadota bacterium]|uniref:type II secretion system protein n=1 Tax=Gallaecimonas pentaromativorans TaxID=584787 RepID=UPI00067E9737|nr:type II secretion system protein [Gallaecimonas pentaromativorans]MED5527014.1 type II secretion system protein [Pseudomonadota bacterium]